MSLPPPTRHTPLSFVQTALHLDDNTPPLVLCPKTPLGPPSPLLLTPHQGLQFSRLSVGLPPSNTVVLSILSAPGPTVLRHQ